MGASASGASNVVNFNPERVSDADLLSNQRSVADHLNAGLYRRSFSPGQFVVSFGANHGFAGASVGANKWPTVDFPDGADTYAFVAFERPAFWSSGRMKITVYYTADVGSTNNFGLFLAVLSVKSSGNLSDTGTTVLLSDAAAVNIAGPATADGEKSTDIYTTTSFDPSARRFGIRVGRKGTTDANANVLQMTEVVVEHIPAKAEVHIG